MFILFRYSANFFILYALKVIIFSYVLPNELVGIFYRALLPRSVGVREADPRPEPIASLRAAVKALGDRIAPKVYEYGFLKH